MVRLVYHRLEFYSGLRRMYHDRLLLVWQAGLQVSLSDSHVRGLQEIDSPPPFVSYMFILYPKWVWERRGVHLLVLGALSE